jgi:hypothetical protein
MMGNYHVRFLEERAAAMQLAYSTKWYQTVCQEQIQLVNKKTSRFLRFLRDLRVKIERTKPFFYFLAGTSN